MSDRNPSPLPVKGCGAVHLRNLPTMAADEGLFSDAVVTARGGPPARIGMSAIKERRLLELEVPCHPGTKVGEYVPFFFCPRSVMLYLLHLGNHPDLDYKEGQGPIVHLQADLFRVVEWADRAEVAWAFSLGNAGTRYTPFRDHIAQLGEINWAAIEATDWRQLEIKEGKMAEFLVFRFLPLALVDRVGVVDAGARDLVETALADSEYGPAVTVTPDWYY